MKIGIPLSENFKAVITATFRASNVGLAENHESLRNKELARYAFIDAMDGSKTNCDADACGSCRTLC